MPWQIFLCCRYKKFEKCLCFILTLLLLQLLRFLFYLFARNSFFDCFYKHFFISLRYFWCFHFNFHLLVLYFCFCFNWFICVSIPLLVFNLSIRVSLNICFCFHPVVTQRSFNVYKTSKQYRWNNIVCLLFIYLLVFWSVCSYFNFFACV